MCRRWFINCNKLCHSVCGCWLGEGLCMHVGVECMVTLPSSHCWCDLETALKRQSVFTERWLDK